MKAKIDPRDPFAPVNLSSDLVYAAQALNAGKADGRQQQIFLRWLIVEVCKKDDLSFRPGGYAGARNTDLAEGKRFVALSVLRAINQTPDMIAALVAQETSGPGRPVEEGDESGGE